MTQRPGRDRPLDGLRVLDLSRVLSISGFGQDGHEAERPAYAPIIHAEAGLIARQADISGGPPADIAFALADALAGLHGTIAILAALKRDLDAAGLAWAEIRPTGDVLAAPSVAGRGTVVEVTDSDGGRRSVVRMPYRFSDAESGPVRGVPETGEHTSDVLREWTGRADLPCAALTLLPSYP